MSSFHYDFILSKRGSLAKVWLAAHWEKKLSKVQICETNVQSLVYDILHPKIPIALRTSSHLLVGLVRIYSRKAKYLLKDCSETLVNIKVAFRPGVPALDKPVKQYKSRKHILDHPLFITEKVDLLDQWIPDVSNVDLDSTMNQGKVEEITLQEEPMKLNSLEDYFDDEGFGEMDTDSIETSQRNFNSCSTVFERGASFADSAYGTEDHSMGDTMSLMDYYSDPFSSTLTPAKDFDLNSPFKKRTDQLPKLMLDMEDFLPPGQNETPNTDEPCPPFSPEDRDDTTIIKYDDLNLHGTNYDGMHGSNTLSLEGGEDVDNDQLLSVKEKRRINDIPLSSDDETQILRLSEGTEVTALDLDVTRQRSPKRSLEDPNDIVILDPVPTSQTKLHCSRKRRKHRLLIDEVIAFDRAVLFDNVKNSSQFVKLPVFAPSTKQEMKRIERDHLLLSKASAFELSPALHKLFPDFKSRKLSNSADATKPITSFESEQDLLGNQSSGNGSETAIGNGRDWLENRFDQNDERLNQNELFDDFIPLQDVEYSSDEETHDCECKANNAFAPYEFDSYERLGESLENEDIREDRFCSYVETVVLKAQPEAVKFHQVAGIGGGKKLSRKTVARRFLKCLIMQRDTRLSLEQESSFADILLRPGLKHVSKESTAKI